MTSVEQIAKLALGADIPDAGYTGPEAFFGIGGVAAAVIFASNDSNANL